MKFYGTPNLYIRISDRYKRFFPFKGFSFDAKGEFTTEHERLIRLLKQQFKYDEENNADTGEDIKTFVCKKCGESFTNHGLFLAHCRKHAREDKK